MSNKSFSIKENPYMKDIQGGEKKVMKKILSVALSTAMAFSMFASVAFGADAEKLTPEQQFNVLKEAGIVQGYPDGLSHLDRTVTRAELAKIIVKSMALEEVTGVASYKDKNYTAKHWAAPFIEAATQAKILEGVSTNPANPLFNPTGNVTVQELAKVLVEANKLEVPTGATNTASDWAKGYVAAAIKAGYIAEGINYQANATRAQTVVAAHAIYEFNNFKVTNAVAKDATNVTLTLSTGEVVEVKLETPLKANEKTDLVYKAKDGRELKYSVTWVVTTATKVESATSTNLKEVEVTFDGEVDKATATDKDNYSINQGAKAVRSATLLEGGKSVRLLLADGHTFIQGTDYTVQVKNVKAGTATLSTASVKFTSADNTLPTATEVKALGNKAIKVTFSEPVKTVAANNFRLDDKAFLGKVDKGANEREVILKDYAGNLSIGAHKLTVSLVEDYAGLKSLAATTDFTVVEDKEAPTVTNITATLEKMTVTFSEDIDPDSVKSDTFYWKSGDTKKLGKATPISGNVYEVDFTANRLPGYETTIFVDGVKDYSGNVIAVKEHKVTATVDLNRPKVADVTYGTNGKEVLTVKFDKAVYATDRANFTVKKGDDLFPVSSIEYAPGSDNKAVNIKFSPALKDGEYSLKVTGVKDRTALGNQIEDYSTTFKVDDTSRPTLVRDVDANESNRSVVIDFQKKMDLATLNNRSNYYVAVSTDGTDENKVTKSIGDDVQVTPILDGRAVVLVFPEYIQGNVKTSFPTLDNPSGTVRSVTVVGMRSAAGNLLDSEAASATKKIVAGKKVNAIKAEQKDYRTIEVTFDQAISKVYSGDFTVSGATIDTVDVKESGDVVVIKTVSDLPSYSTLVSINKDNGIKSYANNTVVYGPVDAVGGAAPKIDQPSSKPFGMDADNKFKISFTTTVAPSDNLGFDLIIKRANEKNLPKLKFNDDYTTKWVAGDIEVTIKDHILNSYDGPFTVQIKDKAEFIKSVNGAVAKESDVYNVTRYYNSGNPTVINVATSQYTAATIQKDATKAVATVQGVTFTAVKEGATGAGYSFKVETVAGTTTPKIAINSSKLITITVDGATNKDVVEAFKTNSLVNGLFVATTSNDDGTLVATTDDVAVTGGTDAVKAAPATLKLTFSNKVSSVEGLIVTVDDKNYSVGNSNEEVKYDTETNSILVILPSTVTAQPTAGTVLKVNDGANVNFSL